MKKRRMKPTLLALIIVSAVLSAQESNVDRIAVPLTDPGKEVTLNLSLVNGGITVTGYDGQEVIIEAQTRSKKVTEKNAKENGMFRIPVNSSSLTVEEHSNIIEIDSESWKRTIDFTIKTPRNSSLNLTCVNHGDIRVENVNGEMEIENVNGSVTLQNVSGSVNAHALNKDLVVTLNAINKDAPMSFSTLNGDIDVTFPSSLKADVKLKSDMGDVFSDFQIVEQKSPEHVIEENRQGKDGRYRVRIDNSYYGTINGGGPQFTFTSFHGDIYIRQAK